MARKRRVSFALDLCFHDSVRRDDVDEVRASLARLGPQASALVNSFCVCGLTALHHSSLEGRQTLTEVLLSFGANPHTFDLNGWQPLHAAASRGHEHIVRQLLKAGADPFAPTSSSGELPSDLTDDNSWEVRRLLSSGADSSLYSRSTSSACDSSDSGIATADSDDFLECSDIDSDHYHACPTKTSVPEFRSDAIHERKSTPWRRIGVVELHRGPVLRRASLVEIERDDPPMQDGPDDDLHSPTMGLLDIGLQETRTRKQPLADKNLRLTIRCSTSGREICETIDLPTPVELRREEIFV